jgi:hypothetical protein
VNSGPNNLDDLQFNAAVVDENAIPGVHVTGEAAKSCGNHPDIARTIFRGDDKFFSRHQLNRTRLKTSQPDFWTLKVDQNGHTPP